MNDVEPPVSYEDLLNICKALVEENQELRALLALPDIQEPEWTQ